MTAPDTTPPPAGAPTVLPGDLDAYWSALSSADEQGAYAAAAAVHERGAPLETVLVDLVAAAQRRVGELWASNQWTVAQEHAATAVSEQVVRRLAGDLPDPTEGSLLLVACVEREWHALPALVVAQTLRSWGLRVEYLGANASRDHLVGRILDVGPRAVLLSASLASSLPRVRRQVEAVRGTGTPVVVGGRAFDADGRRALRLGATAYAATPQQALALMADLPRHVPAAPALHHAGAADAASLQAAGDALARELIIGTDAALRLSGGSEAAVSPDDWRVVLATFAPHVVDCVIGGLLTDDASVVRECRTWLDDVLHGRDAPPHAADAMWETLGRLLRDHPAAGRMVERA
jgi:methanogenic corrinoid protein MtbC1